MINILPEICLVKVITYLDSESLNNFLRYLEDNNDKNFFKLKLRINKSVRAMYPVLQRVEQTHCFIDKINTRKHFMETYVSIFEHLRVSYMPGLFRVLDNNRCYEVILDKLVSKEGLTEKQTKKFLDIVNFNSNPILDSTIKKINVKLDSVKCEVDVSFLDDYLSLGISYTQNPLQNPPQALSV